ncbi:MAG: hypothetical protein HYU57_03915 [Micavibrio aeruginosavorus]|nr:hypothetical protein [Micavibrio aeruginosavorus]
MKLSDLGKSELASVKERFAVASDAYEDTRHTSHALAGGWQRIFDSSEIPGLNDGGFYGSLYKRTINGRDEHIIAFRGMDGITDLDDVANLALGRIPGQFVDAYKFTKIAAEKFNLDPSRIEYVGHSMGGYLAKAVGVLNESEKIYSYNGPGLFHDDLHGLPASVQKEFGENKADITQDRIERSITSINSKFDVVSWIGEMSGKTIKIPTHGHQHRLTSLEESFNLAAQGILGGLQPQRVVPIAVAPLRAPTAVL